MTTPPTNKTLYGSFILFVVGLLACLFFPPAVFLMGAAYLWLFYGCKFKGI